MVQRAPASDKGRRLNSIKLKDFPENQGLADDFFDREFTDEEDEETVVMTRAEIPEDEDGTSGLAIRSVSSLFDDDDISAGDTTIISREMLDEIGDLKENGEAADSAEAATDAAVTESSAAAGSSASTGSSRDSEISNEIRNAIGADLPAASAAAAVSSQASADAARRKPIKAPSSDSINRNPNPAKQAGEKKAPKMPKVKDFGRKKHSAAYRIIKFCIFLLIWIAVAFACYQLYKFGYKVLNDQPMDPADMSKVQITVSGDETNEEMGETLLGYGLIDDIGIFKWRCRLYDAEYEPGTYKLSKSYNTEKILNILAGYVYSDGTMDEETSTEAAAETVAETVAFGEDEQAAPEGDGEANEEAGGDEEYAGDEEEYVEGDEGDGEEG